MAEFSFKTKKKEIQDRVEKIIDDFIDEKNEEKRKKIIEIQNKLNSNLEAEDGEKEILYEYSTEEIRGWSSEISMRLIDNLSKTYKTIKFITFCSVLEASEVEMFFESRSIWNPNTDGCIQVKKDSNRPRIFASVYILCP
ncbi:MAG: dynein light chain Tctex-type family protein [archaeon]|nr:dynein light chain Tctex-type family protein [archaeon]